MISGPKTFKKQKFGIHILCAQFLSCCSCCYGSETLF